jgi:hypothetical protein
MRLITGRWLLALALVAGCSQTPDSDPVSPISGSGGKGGSPVGGSGGSAGSASGGTSGSGPAGSGGSSSGGSSSGGGASGGSGGEPDASPETNSPPDAPPSSGTCGTTPAAFNLDAIGRTEGLVVGPDGTVYFSDFGAHVGRYVPPYDKPAEKTWATVTGATILGITYDPKLKVIYAGSRGADKKLYKIDATDPTKITPIVAVEGGYNGITLGEDGSVFYTDQGGGNIYRVTPGDMKKVMVNKTPVADANGIAFGPDKSLYVLTYGAGILTKLKLENNVEVAREMVVKFAKGNADGIAFDKAGNVYVTSGALWKVTPDKTITMVNPTGGANVEFGTGALSCKELLWAATPPHHVAIDVDGMDVPWHRP